MSFLIGVTLPSHFIKSNKRKYLPTNPFDIVLGISGKMVDQLFLAFYEGNDIFWSNLEAYYVKISIFQNVQFLFSTRFQLTKWFSSPS